LLLWCVQKVARRWLETNAGTHSVSNAVLGHATVSADAVEAVGFTYNPIQKESKHETVDDKRERTPHGADCSEHPQGAG
jgi:hypothetical protein